MRFVDSDQLNVRKVGVVAMLVVSTATTSCGAYESPSPSVLPAPTTEVTPVEQSPELPWPGGSHEVLPEGWTLLAELPSQRGSYRFGALTVESPSVGVFVRCLGSTSMRVEISEVGSFERSCTDDMAEVETLNSFDSRHVEEITVSIDAENENVWEVTVVGLDRVPR